jgi:hypothetical protein
MAIRNPRQGALLYAYCCAQTYVYNVVFIRREQCKIPAPADRVHVIAIPNKFQLPQLLEERYKYREATAAEFGVVRQKTLGKMREAFAAQSAIASMRNQEILQNLNKVSDC